MNTRPAREYTMFVPTQLFGKWREQRPRNQGDLDGEVGRVCYTGVDLLLISFLYRGTWLLLVCVLHGTPCMKIISCIAKDLNFDRMLFESRSSGYDGLFLPIFLIPFKRLPVYRSTLKWRPFPYFYIVAYKPSSSSNSRSILLLLLLILFLRLLLPPPPPPPQKPLPLHYILVIL
jgi:hypothetical protein